ncbi:MAG: hypothetical protein V7603_1445 [Micromonosporaceae bacterium]
MTGGTLDLALAVLGVADLVGRLRLSVAVRSPGRSSALGAIAIPYGCALLVTALVVRAPWPQLFGVAAAAVAVSVAVRPAVSFLHTPGALSLATTVGFRVTAVIWLGHFAATADLPVAVRVLTILLWTVAAVMLPVQLLDSFLVAEAAFRRAWRERDPSPARGYRPRVSVHVPCHAEPPAVVIATLDALARVAYRDLEVLVIDNNTVDEALWRPVQRHCERLGERFRFLHVEGLSGAKAGALNYALARTDPAAEVVAVVDADYQAEPGFPGELVDAFGDTRLAFVQTSHDYRDWAASAYLTGCYWEYRAMYAGYMRSRSQRETALTTGTMCLVRRSALERVGGWAEWCCTEDSELSVRLHAAGYTGRYVHRTYGRGLVPQEFAGYRRQRHRWIYGPTQEFRRHWRLYLPARWARPSALTWSQKLLFAHHGLRELATGAAALAVTATAVALTVLLALRPPGAALPAAATIGLAAGAASALLALWPLFRGVIGCTRRTALRAILCRMALADTRLSAGLAGCRTGTGEFRRTDKFPASSNRRKALASTGRETARGFAALALAGWALVASAGADVIIPLVAYLILRGACWLTAPILSMSADRSIRGVPAPARPGPDSAAPDSAA